MILLYYIWFMVRNIADGRVQKEPRKSLAYCATVAFRNTNRVVFVVETGERETVRGNSEGETGRGTVRGNRWEENSEGETERGTVRGKRWEGNSEGKTVRGTVRGNRWEGNSEQWGGNRWEGNSDSEGETVLLWRGEIGKGCAVVLGSDRGNSSSSTLQIPPRTLKKRFYYKYQVVFFKVSEASILKILLIPKKGSRYGFHSKHADI